MPVACVAVVAVVAGAGGACECVSSETGAGTGTGAGAENGHWWDSAPGSGAGGRGVGGEAQVRDQVGAQQPHTYAPRVRVCVFVGSSC